MLELPQYIVIALVVLLVISYTEWLNPIYDWLQGKTFNSYEQIVFYSWKNSLTSKNREILEKQMGQLRLIQRGAGGAKVACYYHNEKKLVLFKNVSKDLHVATVELIDKRKTPTTGMKAKIFLHEGRFFSIEFPKRPKRLAMLKGFHLDNLSAKELIIHKSVD
jgi:hypothetical protein